MKLIFHGAAKEVGKSCIEIATKNNRILVDAGIKVENLKYPGVKSLDKINAVILSHAHLDHSGALPLFVHNKLKCPIYATSATKLLTNLLLKDARKVELIENFHPGYSKEDMRKVISLMINKEYNKKNILNDSSFRLVDAGHIPGSSSVLLDNENKRIFYTADINTMTTNLLNGANIEVNDIDLMITEATYGARDHPNRQTEEKKFLDKIKETIDNGGSVLIPAFAVGRSQEIMLMLNKKKFDVPVYIDGMSIEVTRLFLKKPFFIKDEKKLADAFGNVFLVKGCKNRKEIMQRQGIFITTSGMLTGGPVVDYMKEMACYEKNSILLTGYQSKGTNGRALLENGSVFIEGKEVDVMAFYKQYDFSAHAGARQLKNLIKKINPCTLAIQHGEPKECDALAEWALALGYKTFVPETGKSIKI